MSIPQDQLTPVPLKDCRRGGNMFSIMGRFVVRRLCAALTVLVFLASLPMQGIAMASAAAAAPAPWSADADGSMPCGCNGCVDQPAVGMLCPVVFCIGLSAVIAPEQESAGVQPDIPSIRFEESTGLSSAPDPDPPRTSFLS